MGKEEVADDEAPQNHLVDDGGGGRSCGGGGEEKGEEEASPQSPLEGYSSASASGGDEGARAPGSACLAAATPDDRLTKVVGNARAPSVSSNPASSSIQRPPSKKMTKPELQAVERTLLEERAKLHKEMGDLRRAVEVLRADNRKMQVTTNNPCLPVFWCFSPAACSLSDW
ncbi:unnamed protein product [Musa textilis]